MATIPELKQAWYPVRVFFGRAELIKRTLEEADVEYFYPMRTTEKITKGLIEYTQEPLVRSLLFIRTTRDNLRMIKLKFNASVIPYYDRETNSPLVVPDKQMDLFIKLCRMKEEGLQYLGDDSPKYHQGDKVRVKEGVFKGLVGHIKRIRHDRKLIVTIEGVAAFATSYIPPAFLEVVKEVEK